MSLFLPMARLWWRLESWNCRRQARALNAHSADVNRRVEALNDRAAQAELKLLHSAGRTR